MPRVTKYFLLLYGLMLPCLSFSQDGIEVKKDTVGMLEEVVVTATRKITTAQQLPFSYNLVTAKQMARAGFRTIPEALMGSVGVFVQKTNHGGGSAFVRGLTGNQTLVLVDGIRFNNATFRYGPNQYLNTVDMYTVDKVEVVRGTGSVQYGSDAMGGVIQLFTREPAFGKKLFSANTVGKMVSRDMEYTARAELGYRSEKMAMSAGYTNRKFGDLFGGDTTGRQLPSGYAEQAFDVKMKFRIGKQTALTASHQYVKQEQVPLYHKVKLENFAYYFFSPQERKMSYLKLETKTRAPLLSAVNFILSAQESIEKRDYYKQANANRFTEEDRVKTMGATVDISSVPGTDWQANSGIEYYHDKVNSVKWQIPIAPLPGQRLRGLYPDASSDNNFSLYTLHHIKAGAFDIEAGLRYNTMGIHIPDTSISTIKLGNVSVHPSSLVVNAALGYSINRRSRVYSSFSTGYRTPNIDDMGSLGLVDFRYEVPAYGLRPEKSYHTELGYRFHNRQVQTSVAIYYMYLTDLISRVQVPGQQAGGYNVYTKENNQASFVKGAELELRYQLSAAFSFYTGAAYAYGQNVSANEPMRRIPPFNGRVQLQYHWQHWYVSVEDLFAGAQTRLAKGDKEDNRIQAGGTPGWNLVNLNGGYAAKHFSVRTGIQNLLNIDYRTHGSGINGMGRAVWLSLQVML
ncbi:MAG: TonB-dependent receptor [Sediminibacterium sp.]|nr:TonB-dependent receptor [Sediminibacterium sp.]MDP3129145.1 TonB-dependent receptor [Sediminibacterium sp.]